jgi:drug/metabolite transporter (DMT)-like permease
VRSSGSGSRPQGGHDRAWLRHGLCAGVFINALARADASFITPFSHLTLVFAAIYDGVIFGVVPTAVSLLGALTIICGAGLLAWREAVHRRNK